jgi:parallel beta-helix repeat protein
MKLRAATIILMLFLSFEASGTSIQKNSDDQVNTSTYYFNSTISTEALNSLFFSWDGPINTIYASTVLYLPFNNISYLDENNTYAVDISVYGNNATVSAAYAQGKYETGLSLNGSGQYATVPGSNSLNLSTDSYSINLWAKRNSLSGNQEILDKRASSKGLLFFYASGYLTGQTWNTTDRIQADVTTSSGWHMLTYVVDRSINTSFLYVDAVQIKNKTAFTIAQNINNTASLSIGWAGDSTNYFNGTLDEIQIYRRVLNQSELDELLKVQIQKKNITVYDYGYTATLKENRQYQYNITADDATLNGTVDYLCRIPTPDAAVFYNTTWCNGDYNFSENAFRPFQSGIRIQGNSTRFLGNNLGFGVYLNGYDNIILQDLYFKGYNTGIGIYSAKNITLKNIIVLASQNQNIVISNTSINTTNCTSNDTGSQKSAFYLENVTNSLFENNHAANTWIGIFFFNPGANNTIKNNLVHTADVGVYSDGENQTSSNNTVINATRADDGYNVGFRIFGNNSIYEGDKIEFGTTGVLIQGSQNLTIKNLYINSSNQTGTRAFTWGEPRTGIFISLYYERWGSGSASRNINLSNNTFSGVPVYVRIQNRDNISVDLGGYQYRYLKYGFIGPGIDIIEEYYINSSQTASLETWNRSTGSGERLSYTWFGIDGVTIIETNISASMIQVRNPWNAMLNFSLYNTSKYFFGLENTQSENAISISIPADNIWYHQVINFEIIPRKGEFLNISITGEGLMINATICTANSTKIGIKGCRILTAWESCINISCNPGTVYVYDAQGVPEWAIIALGSGGFAAAAYYVRRKMKGRKEDARREGG